MSASHRAAHGLTLQAIRDVRTGGKAGVFGVDDFRGDGKRGCGEAWLLMSGQAFLQGEPGQLGAPP